MMVTPLALKEILYTAVIRIVEFFRCADRIRSRSDD